MVLLVLVIAIIVILFALALFHPFFTDKGNLDTFIVMVSLLSLSVNNLIDAYPSLQKIRDWVLEWGIWIIGVGLLLAGFGAWYFDKSKINCWFLLICFGFALIAGFLFWHYEFRNQNVKNSDNSDLVKQKKSSLIYAYYWLSLFLIYIQYIDFKELYKNF